MSLPSDSDHPGPARRRRGLVTGAGAGVVVAAVVIAGVLSLGGEDRPSPGLTVTWGGSEGKPSCVYDPDADTVDARLTIDGEAPQPDEVTVTVTAYADENTSKPVGSSSRSVEVEGTVHMPFTVTIPVRQPPHVGEDSETACSLSVEY